MRKRQYISKNKGRNKSIQFEDLSVWHLTPREALEKDFVEANQNGERNVTLYFFITEGVPLNIHTHTQTRILAHTHIHDHTQGVSTRRFWVIVYLNSFYVNSSKSELDCKIQQLSPSVYGFVRVWLQSRVWSLNSFLLSAWNLKFGMWQINICKL